MSRDLSFQLSSLDNVIQFGIALSLAYLNLERFRYRKSAPHEAYQALEDAKKDGVSDIDRFNEYLNLEKAANKLKKIESNFELSDIGTFKTWFTKCLVFYFGKNLDRWITVIFSLLLAFILIVNTGYFKLLSQFLNNHLDLCFWSVLFFSSYPVCNTMLGRTLKNRLHNFSDKRIQSLRSAVETLNQKKRMEVSKAKAPQSLK